MVPPPPFLPYISVQATPSCGFDCRVLLSLTPQVFSTGAVKLCLSISAYVQLFLFLVIAFCAYGVFITFYAYCVL